MAEFVTVAKVSDFREGKIRRYFVDSREVGIVLWNGEWHGFNNRCPHADFQLHFGFIEDDKIYCPIHYAEFDVCTGKALGGPALLKDLGMHEVRIQDEDVQIALQE